MYIYIYIYIYLYINIYLYYILSRTISKTFTLTNPGIDKSKFPTYPRHTVIIRRF